MKISDIQEAFFDPGGYGPRGDKYSKKVSTTITKTQQFFKKHESQLKNALNAYKNKNIIWRGVPTDNDEEMLFVDPTKFERKAANTHNYMNLLQSTLPSWKSYPKRNFSLICTTDKEYAWEYGDAYVVLPLGNPAIGICPTNDWFGCFPRYDGIEAMNSDLQSMYELIRSEKSPESLPQSHELIKTLTAMSPKFLEYSKNYGSNDLPSFWGDLAKFPNLLAGLNALTDPAKNKFKAVTLSQFKKVPKREVWLSAPSILIKPELLKEILKVR